MHDFVSVAISIDFLGVIINFDHRRCRVSVLSDRPPLELIKSHLTASRAKILVDDPERKVFGCAANAVRNKFSRMEKSSVLRKKLDRDYTVLG